MLKSLLDKIGEAIAPAPAQTPADREHALRLATAVLMVDVARADHAFLHTEMKALLDLIAAHFELSAAEAEDLAELAGETARESVSLHEFTTLIHDNVSEPEKAAIVSLLWQIAYADGRLDKYESALVLRISDLLYVPRGRVMRLKHDAAVAAGAREDD